MQARTHALELVGPLLHPVSRSETWRRLVNPANVNCVCRVYFQARRSGPWRRAENELRWLGGRASIARGGPKNRRKPTAKLQRSYCTWWSAKSKQKSAR